MQWGIRQKRYLLSWSLKFSGEGRSGECAIKKIKTEQDNLKDQITFQLPIFEMFLVCVSWGQDMNPIFSVSVFPSAKVSHDFSIFLEAVLDMNNHQSSPFPTKTMIWKSGEGSWGLHRTWEQLLWWVVLLGFLSTTYTSERALYQSQTCPEISNLIQPHKMTWIA